MPRRHRGVGVQLAKEAARGGLQARVLSLLEAEYRSRRVAIIRSRSYTAVFPTEEDYNATLAALNSTYASLQANVLQHRHSAACQAALAPVNLPALGDIPADKAWDAALSSGAPPTAGVSRSRDIHSGSDSYRCRVPRCALRACELECASPPRPPAAMRDAAVQTSPPACWLSTHRSRPVAVRERELHHVHATA